MGLKKNIICVMIHSGSRGLGYQVCDDSLAALRKAPAKYGIELPDASWPAPRPQCRRPGVSRRDALRRQLRMGESATAHVANPRDLRRTLRPHMGIAPDGPHLRCRPQHRQNGRTRSRWPTSVALRPSQGATRAFRRHSDIPDQYRQIGSRSSFPATWAGRVGCSSASPAA